MRAIREAQLDLREKTGDNRMGMMDKLISIKLYVGATSMACSHHWNAAKPAPAPVGSHLASIKLLYSWWQEFMAAAILNTYHFDWPKLHHDYP